MHHFDKSIQPVCLLMALIAGTVSVYNMLHIWVHITWRILLASALTTIGGLTAGIVVEVISKQRLPQLKTVATVTGIQNTLLATVILQISYPTEDSSLMAVTVVCIEAMTLLLMFASYFLHVVLWLAWPRYRMCHDNVGIGGLQCTIGETLVRNMVKAGEIKFYNKSHHSMFDNLDAHGNTNSSCCSAISSDTADTKVSKISERNISSNQSIHLPKKSLGTANKAFSSSFDSLGRTSHISNASSSYQRNYFMNTGSSETETDDQCQYHDINVDTETDPITGHVALYKETHIENK